MAQSPRTREQITNYLHQKVAFLFERMMVELLAVQPFDVIQWSIEWLDKKGRDLVRSRTQSQADYSSIKSNQYASTKKQNSSSEEDGEDEDEVDILPQSKAPSKIQRISVSAEAFGLYNKKENFVARIIPKSESQKQRIKNRLLQSFMFQALSEKELATVVDAMEEKYFRQGDWLIRQGDDGDNLYIVDSGQLDCYKRFPKKTEDTYLKSYYPGESFGELALLYNAPRAASICAKVDSITFALDRATFNHIVKDAAVRKRQKYESVLKSIELLDSMDPYESVQVCDGIKDRTYKPGEYVIREGEKGDIFYMIEEGTLIATKTLIPGQEPVKVYDYKAGEYFGEVSLLRNVPRQANVMATSEVKVVYLDQSAFKRLLGPVENILKRNQEKYQKYMTFN